MIKNKKVDNSKKLEKAIKSSAKEVLPDFLKNTDIQILMPLEATLMRSDFSRVQLSVLLSIIEKLANKLREVIDIRKNMQAGDQLSLFDENEFLVNEKNEKVYRIKLCYKDVGVNQNHYTELENSIKALAGLPISTPYRSEDGKEYELFTNFCDVYVPKDQKKNIYCIVDFKQDVAQSLMKVDFGYHYVGKKASKFFGNCSKYCERIYWLIQGYQNIGFVTISTSEFRKRYGLEKTYKNFNSIKTKILDVSRDEIKKVFFLRGCDCWFTYELIYNGKKKVGEPSDIKFIIHKDNPSIEEKDFLDKQLQMEEISGSAEFISILKEDLHVGEQVAKRIAQQLTKDNYQAAINKAISLKAELDSGKEIQNPSRYVIISIGNFFTEFEKKSKDTPKEDRVKGIAEWTAMISEFCKGVDAKSVNETISRMSFGGFDDTTTPKKTLTINVPSRDIQQRIENDYREMFLRMLKKHFGEGIAVKFSIPKEKEETDATE